MIVQLIRKIVDKISKILAAFIYRFEKKTDNPQGYIFGGPKVARYLLIAIILAILGAALTTIFIKKGVLITVEQNLDRETTPGAKMPSDIAGGIDKNDLARFEARSHDLSNRVDCDRIMANLRIRGTLTDREKIDFDRSCRDKVGKTMAEIIDKILSGEVPASVAAEILQNTSGKNADAVLRALNNDDVKKALRTDAGVSLAKNLGGLGNLSDKQLSEAVKMIRAAPPQFRDDVIDTVKAAAAVENPDARDALLRTIGKARSKEELHDIKAFADVVAKALPDEQKVFTEAYEKAPDLETRRSVAKAASEIIQIPADDPVRGKLTSMVKMVADLPPEQQKNAYNKIADVANVYRTTTDPDVKKAIAEAIMSAQSPNDIIALAQRLQDLKDAERAGPIDKDSKLAAILGHDDEAMNKIRAAAELVRGGDLDSAKKALDGKLSADELEHVLKKANDSRNDPFKGQVETSKEDASAARLKELMIDRQNLVNHKKTLEARIGDYLREGLDRFDPRLVDLYKELGATDDKMKSINDIIGEVRLKLRQRLLALKKRNSAEFAEVGLTMPDIEIKIPDDAIAEAAPEERLANLRDVSEFWSSQDGSYRKRHEKFAKFNFQNAGSVGGDAGAGQDSLLAKATSKMSNTWYAGAYGQGNAGTSTAGLQFEMGRTLHIPGFLMRIPDGGIPSKKASTVTVLFQFLESVANRKTGKIEIPAGSVALCRVKDFENDTGRLNANCNAVDVGGRSDITVNLSLGDAAGADGVLGQIRDERGWQLAGIFLTAFSAAVLNGISNQYLAPIQAQTTQSAQNYLVLGGGTGASNILQDVAQKQVEAWSTANTFWIGYDGMLATIRQN